jgi:exopolysaccharide biosynthesis polyprenyl glycosylphosphotransferase
MIMSFIAGAYVEQGIWAMPDRVNFRQSLPWFIIFTLGIMYFNSVFDLSRRMHHLAFSAITSVIMINVLMMALPFFDVLYHVYITTLFLIVLFECLSMGVWVLFFHSYWLRHNPRVPTVVVCDETERGEDVAYKINSNSLVNRVDKIMSYSSDKLLEAITPFKAVILVRPPLDKRNEIALKCWEMNKELIIVPDVYELIVNNATFVQFDDLMTYKAKSMGLSRNQRIIKRTFDILVSLLALVILSPLMLITALVVKSDRGSALFSQKRVTKNGRVFTLYKFRTMIPNAEKCTGPTLATKDDPRITKYGKWLRQTRLDEIPQLWNVFKGDMSLVGPRPEREYFINQYMEAIPEYQFRTNVRAGLTGLAHVLGKYSTAPEERIMLDLTYIQNYSFSLDMKILIETVRVVFTKEYAEGVEVAGHNSKRHGETV